MIQRHTIEQTPRALAALHINAAGECRRAAMESARTGKVVGFYGPELHKQSARSYLLDARQRRCDSRFGWLEG
jgi:hypothetical protein